MIPFLNNSFFSKVSFMKLHLNKHNLLLLATDERTWIYIMFLCHNTVLIVVRIPQQHFEWHVSFIFTKEDVSFYMISFWASVYITFYHPNEIYFCQNDRSRVTPAIIFISGLSCKQFRVTKNYQTPNWKFCNEISCLNTLSISKLSIIVICFSFYRHNQINNSGDLLVKIKIAVWLKMVSKAASLVSSSVLITNKITNIAPQ